MTGVEEHLQRRIGGGSCEEEDARDVSPTDGSDSTPYPPRVRLTPVRGVRELDGTTY